MKWLCRSINLILEIWFEVEIRICCRTESWDCTEVGRAFLIHFQKIFLNKVFLMIKIARELKFYTRIVTSGSKSVKKGQNILKKATIWTYIWFFWNFFALANLKHINSYIMQKKYVMSSYKFRSYFFTLGEVEALFSNLLSTAINNFIKWKVDFFSK